MSKPAKLRWGILGAARINERLMPAINGCPNSELVAIASRRAGAARETLRKYAPDQTGVKVYDQLEALLEDETVQAVYVPLANHEHAEWALRAVQHGKHVLCEKPMALHEAEIAAIHDAARGSRVTVMEGFMYRFHPQHDRVAELIQSGLIGELRSVRSSYSFMMRPARMYRLAESVERGGGAMWDIGPYAIHSSRLYFDCSPVAATAMAKYTDTGADITTSGILDFGDGRRAHFDVSFECARRSEYEITGTKGGIKCHAAWQNPGDIPLLSWWTEDGRRCEEKLPVADHFMLEVEHFGDCVLNGKAALLSPEDAKMNCRVINAVLQSAAQGKTIVIA